MKKVLAVLLCMVVCLQGINVLAYIDYSDVGEEYTDATDILSNLKIMIGFDDGTFHPNDALTRAEAATIMVRLLGKDNWVSPGEASFTDVESTHWAADYIYRAEANGIINGMGDGTFAPDSPLTREQAVTMLGRVYELVLTNAISGGEGLPRESVLSFTDHWNISDYAKNYVYFFAGLSIVDGMGDGSFAPKSNMTREQAIKVAAVTAGTLG